MNTDCTCCNLLDRYAKGDTDMKIVYESEYSLALHSIKPFAEVHIMIIAKKHIPSLFDISENDGLVKDMWKAIKIASDYVFSLCGGCKLEMYTGIFPTFTAVKHFHCHVIYDASID